jgi:hypothetical protein
MRFLGKEFDKRSLDVRHRRIRWQFARTDDEFSGALNCEESGIRQLLEILTRCSLSKSDKIASLKHVKRPPWRIGNPPKQFKSAFVVQCPAYLPRFYVCSFVA